jgi:hypothetical protein
VQIWPEVGDPASISDGGFDGYRRKQIEKTEKSKPLPWHAAFYLVQLHAQLNQKDEAFMYLQIGYNECDHKMAHVKVNPRLDKF